MKKTFIILAVLGTFSLVSCKKAYDCTCTTTSTGTASVIAGGTANAVDVADINSGNTTYNTLYPQTSKTVASIDKTSKGSANAACASTTDTETSVQQDYSDYDSDGIMYEPAYQWTTVTKSDCTAEKQ